MAQLPPFLLNRMLRELYVNRLSRHVVGNLKDFYFIEDFIAFMLMWTQKVIVSDPERQIIVGTVDVVEPICMAVRSFISTVQSFNHLFEWTMFSLYFGCLVTDVIHEKGDQCSFYCRFPLKSRFK